MRSIRISLCVFLLALLFSGPATIEAGGRIKPEREGGKKGSSSILVTSWFRDRVIRVAVANMAGKAQPVKVAIGTEGIQTDLFVSQSLTISAHSISIVYFPVMEKTSKGGIREADYVTVLRPDGHLIDSQAVQTPDPYRAQLTPEGFLAASGDRMNISYDLEPKESLRLVFVPESPPVSDKIRMEGRPRKGFMQTCSEKDLAGLGLTGEYLKQARTRLADHLGFIVKAGERARISVDYTVPKIRDCAVVRLSDYQYLFATKGSILHGGGPVATVMIYNPAVMKIAPSFLLVPEGSGDVKQKMK